MKSTTAVAAPPSGAPSIANSQRAMPGDSARHTRRWRLGLAAFLTVVGSLVGVVPALAVSRIMWTTVSSLSAPRADLAAAAAPCPGVAVAAAAAPCVYAVGGSSAAATLGTVESYNPTTNMWSLLPSLLTPRANLAAAAAPCPMAHGGTCVYAVGGSTKAPGAGTVESYNPATNMWSPLAPLLTPRGGLAAAAAPCPAGQIGTCVYAVGGSTSDAVATVESYNPATNMWSPLTPLPTPRGGLAAATASCPAGQIGICVYAVGGGTSAVPSVGTVEAYNPTTNAWTAVAPLPTPRASLAAAATPCPPGQTGSCVYAVGGSTSAVPFVGTVESYNPASNAWTTLPSLPTPRAGLAAAAAPCPPGTGDCAYAVGGINFAGAIVATVEAFDPPAGPADHRGHANAHSQHRISHR